MELHPSDLEYKAEECAHRVAFSPEIPDGWCIADKFETPMGERLAESYYANRYKIEIARVLEAAKIDAVFADQVIRLVRNTGPFSGREFLRVLAIVPSECERKAAKAIDKHKEQVNAWLAALGEDKPAPLPDAFR